MSASVSGTSAYVTPAEFLLRKDSRPAQELTVDTGGISADLSTDPVLLAILKECSGLLESAAVAGSRYTVDDINTLITTQSNAGEMVKGLICDLAAHRLCERRWASSQETLAGYTLALDFLKRLRDGETVLPLDTVVRSSNVVSQNLSQSQLDDLNLMSRNTRFFGLNASFGRKW